MGFVDMKPFDVQGRFRFHYDFETQTTHLKIAVEHNGATFNMDIPVNRQLVESLRIPLQPTPAQIAVRTKLDEIAAELGI